MQTGHKFVDCDVWKKEEVERLAAEKKRKREAQYHRKRMRRAAEWDEHLRHATGVHGFTALYEVLGLPTGKLANAAAIKAAYRKMSLLWHPDKHQGKPTEEESAQKFMEIKSAFDLLQEGLEKGSIDGVTVASAGELAGPAAAAAAAAGGGGGGGAAVTPPLVLATLTEEQIKIKRAAEQKVAALIGQKMTKQ